MNGSSQPLRALGRIGAPAAQRAGRRRRAALLLFLRKFADNRSALFGALLVILLVSASLAAPLLTPFEPLALGTPPLQPPGPIHYMGTDDLGRDVFAQFLYGGRSSVLVGLVAAVISTTIGILLGAVSGYRGGWVDDVIQRVTEMFSIVPSYFLAMVTVAILGANIVNVIVVIGLLSWPPATKLTRAEFMTLKTRSFVDAAKMNGAGSWSIVFGEILPNAMPPIIVQTILTISVAVLMEATLSFLGLGDPNLVSWGLMLNKAQSFLTMAPWMAIFPGLGISLFILGLNLTGDGLNQALNPRLRRQAKP